MTIGYVANTDAGWFEFLRSLPQVEEANFWNPSAHFLFRGPMGSPFFFRLKAPINKIGGFGLVSYAQRLPLWLAWECFGSGNGSPDLESMRRHIDRLRQRSEIETTGARAGQIGCIVLSEVVFFPPEDWVEQPNDWSKANLRYARYDLTKGEGLRVWEECQARVAGLGGNAGLVGPMGPRCGAPLLVRPRLGQGVFRLSVSDAYRSACAITGEPAIPVLEAAHIQPYAQGGDHEVPNGLLLRSDLHRLFDRGYLTVTSQLRVEVSQQLKHDFGHAGYYFSLHGAAIKTPARGELRPNDHRLAWHNKNVFRS